MKQPAWLLSACQALLGLNAHGPWVGNPRQPVSPPSLCTCGLGSLNPVSADSQAAASRLAQANEERDAAQESAQQSSQDLAQLRRRNAQLEGQAAVASELQV